MTAKRRSVSVKGRTNARLMAYCQGEGQSLSGFVEDLIAEKMDSAGVPLVDEASLEARELERESRVVEVERKSPTAKDLERNWKLPLIL